MTEKLYHKLDQVEIRQTVSPIRFKDEAINKIQRKNINFGNRSFIFIPFIVFKDSHQKGVKMRAYKGGISEKKTLI
jgi:hypothetical protein